MAEKKTIELEIKSNLADAEKSLGSLKSQLRQAQAEVGALSDKFGATSKEAVEAAKSAAILKDKIGDAKALTDAFNPDAKFKAVSSSLAGVASGFAAYQGALGLVGVESKDLEKQLLKVQSAMAIAEGLQGLGEAKDSFRQLQAVGVNAFKAIKAEIGATGIGLIVIAAGAIYAYWDDIKETVSGVSEEQKKLNGLSKINADLASSKLKDLNNQDNVLKLQGKSEKEILNIKIKATDEAISSAKIQVENQKIINNLAIKGTERNAKIMQSILKSSLESGALGLRLLAAPIDLVLSTANKVSEALGFGKITAINLNDEISKLITTGSKLGANLFFDPEKVKADGNATIKEAKESIDKMVNDRAGMKLAINAIDKTAANESKKIKEDAKAAAKQLAEEKKKNDEEIAKEYRDKQISEEYAIGDAIDAAKKANLDAGKTTAQLAIEAEDAAYKLKYDMAVKYGQDTIELEKQHNAIQATNAKSLADEKVAIDQKVADAKKRIEDASFAVAEGGINLLKGLFQKNKGIQKALLVAESAMGIAKIIINTQAANAADRLYSATLGPVAGPIYLGTKLTLNKVGAGIGIAANIAATSKALGALGGGGAPSGGGDTGGGGAGGAAPAAPAFNVVGASSTNQLAQTIGNKEAQPIKAYVVANDVTTQQSLDRNIVSSASIG